MTGSISGDTTADNMPFLESHKVTRRFGAFTALENVDFAVAPGEIAALLGENGAGKSTLMNILSGLLRPTEGTILLNGKSIRFASPADAAANGIGMVHQHFLLVPPMSVAENLLLGASETKNGRNPLGYPMNQVLADAKTVADDLNWQIPWDEPAGNLSVGTQQRIEILKALRGDTRLLIFDEPTAVLTPNETPELFATIRRLAQSGRAVIFISHKLDEVLSLAEKITVLRRGKVVYRTTASQTNANDLAKAMVGSDSKAAKLLFATVQAEPKSLLNTDETPRLTVEQLTVTVKERRLLDDIDFAVASGVIFGIAGVDGNGQGELADLLSGLLRPTSGTIMVDGKPLSADPRRFLDAGVVVIPADRQLRGLAMPMSLTENFALGVWGDKSFRSGGLLHWAPIRKRTANLIERFDIRATGIADSVLSLSGGNQQKVVIARALADNPRVVIAVNPTRGLDVGAIAYVHDALRNAQKDGAAIVLISTELDEVRKLADRVAVLYAGRLSDIVPPNTPRERFGLLMGGKSDPVTAP